MLTSTLAEIQPLKAYQNTIYRIVETQEYAATTTLVDTLEEQSLLEQLLDQVKPAYKSDTHNLHYLISTPFRYPPLKHGSRFGSTLMPSFYYGSENVETVLSECAYYRFVFLDDMSLSYTKPIFSEHMSFSVNAKTNNMADLTQVTSEESLALISSVDHYQFSQQLGKILTQEKGCDLIRFFSVRNMNNGVNVAIKRPNVITSKQPTNNINWICQTSADCISFNTAGSPPKSYDLADFLVAGRLPRPA